MRPQHAFRPAPLDCLEDRVALSQAPALAAMTASVTSQASAPPFNYAQVAGQVNQAFNSFRDQFNNELKGFLTPGGKVTLTALRTFTTQQVAQLARQLQLALLAVPGGSSGLTPFLLNQVNGQESGALLSTLNGIPGNTGLKGTPSSLYGLIANNAINTAQLAANNLLSAYSWGYGLGLNGNGSVTPLPAASYARLTAQVNNDFNTFRANYVSEMNSFLASASTGSGTVSLAQFQTFILQQTGQLVMQVNTALGNVPGASNGLSAFILNQVNGGFSADMLQELNNIPSNTGPTGAPDSLYSLAATDTLINTQLAANNLMSAYNWGLALGLAAARG